VAFCWRQKHPHILMGWLWYLGMLVPVIGLILQVGAQSRADRYTYLPQIGLYILLTWTVVELTASWRSRRWVLGGGALAVLAVLIFCARTQTSYWRDSKSLWDHTLACTSDNRVAQNNLAWLLGTLTPAEGGDPARAVTLAQRACELTGNNDANSLDTLAVAYAATGRFDDAMATTQTAITLARAGGQAELLQKMEARLELYRGGQAYHPPADVPRPRNP
jgi:protein O-mannosyl-transferase